MNQRTAYDMYLEFVAEREKQTMPGGYMWPQYKSGEPMEIGDTVRIDSADPLIDGRMATIKSFIFYGADPIAEVEIGNRRKKECVFWEELEEA